MLCFPGNASIIGIEWVFLFGVSALAALAALASALFAARRAEEDELLELLAALDLRSGSAALDLVAHLDAVRA